MSAPLDGLRILDCSRMTPGGYCTMLLAELGAEVVKLEDTVAGDYVRFAGPFVPGAEPTANSTFFIAINRGKRSVQIDLKRPEGRDAFVRLVAGFDVLLESFRPGVLDRLGVGYDVLQRAHPGLVYCAITGYGLTGTGRLRAGHDLNYVARTGMLDLMGAADEKPQIPSVQIADVAGGSLMAAVGILAALRERERSGLGQVVDVSMTDGALSLLAPFASRVLAAGPIPRGGMELAGRLACYAVYAASDGYVTLGALERKFWDAFCLGAGLPHLRERHLDDADSATARELATLFAGRSRAAWAAFAGEHDCCLEPVATLGEALASEAFGEREMVVHVEQRGAGTIAQLAHPVKFGRTPALALGHAPVLGANTGSELERAGLTPAEIDALAAAGAVRLAGGPVGTSRKDTSFAF